MTFAIMFMVVSTGVVFALTVKMTFAIMFMVVSTGVVFALTVKMAFTIMFMFIVEYVSSGSHELYVCMNVV